MLRSLALALFVLGTLPMALVEPFVGLLLWVLFSYMNPHRIAYGFAYSFHWVLMIASLTLFSMLIHPQKRQPIPWGPVPVLLLLFLLWTAITTTTAVMESLAVARWVQFFKIQIMVFATLVLVTDLGHRVFVRLLGGERRAFHVTQGRALPRSRASRHLLYR